MGLSEIVNRIVGRTLEYHNNLTSGLRKKTSCCEAPRITCRRAPIELIPEKGVAVQHEERDLSGWKALHEVGADEETYPIEGIQHNGLREAMIAIRERSNRQFRPASEDTFPELRRIRQSYPLSITVAVMLGLDPAFKYAIFGRLKDPSEIVESEIPSSDRIPDPENIDPDDWIWNIRNDPGLTKVLGMKPYEDSRQTERAICITAAMEHVIFGTS